MRIIYFLRFGVLLGLLSLIIGCATNINELEGGGGHGSKTRLTTKQRHAVIATAKSQIGKPYRPGGASPQTGFDCSGLAMYSFSKAGVAIQRDSRSQAQQFATVKKPQVGDMIFFKINGRTVSHSGIYLGNQRMVHAPSSGGRVEIVSLNQPYWKKTFYKFGRI